MLDTFIFSINAILPIVLLVLLGYILRAIGFFTDEFLAIGNKFVFTVGFFCLMFANIYDIDSLNSAYVDLIIFATISILCAIALGFVYVMLFVHDNAQKGVLLQAFFRSNFSIIGIPLAKSICGVSGEQAATIILTVSIPLFNIFSVIFLTIFVNTGKSRVNLSQLCLRILKNPLIDGIALGVLCLFIRPHLNGWTLRESNFRFLYVCVENIAKITSPFALLVLGGQFRFSATKRLLKQIITGTLVRLVIVPILVLLAVHLFCPRFGAAEYAALLALFGSPIAVASAIMATQMHNDDSLARQLLVWTTLFSTITIFVFVVFFRSIGVF